MEIIKKREYGGGGGAPKIIETPKYLIIGGQLYNKTDLSPVKFGTIDANDITFGSYMCTFKRFIFSNYNDTKRYFEQLVKPYNYCMVEDNNPEYSNRFYITTQYQTCGGILRVIEEDIDDVTGKPVYKYLLSLTQGESASATNRCGIGSWGPCSTWIFYSGGFNIIHQEKDYLVVKQNWPHANGVKSTSNAWGSGGNQGNACSLFKLDKRTLQRIEIHSGGELKQDASYNYFYMEHRYVYDYIYINWHLNHYIIKFDSVTNTTTTIYSKTDSGYAADITCNPVKVGDSYYFLVDKYVTGTGEHKYHLCKLTLNDNSCTQEYIEIIGTEQLDLDGTSLTNVTHILIHELHYIQNRNGDYLVLVARSQPNGTWYYPQHKLAVIKLENDTAEVKHVISFVDNPCRGCLPFYEEEGRAEVLITLHEKSCLFWKFNYDTEEFVNTFSVTGSFFGIGMDELHRLYIEDTDDHIQMFDKIETSFSKVYFNEKIVQEDKNSTTLCFYTKNFMNEYTSDNVIINLYNGITFEDGTVEKQFVTSEYGPTEVSVLITATTNVKARATIAVTSRIPEGE